ncbi:MAG TPA: hypothetical protein PK987_05955 [Ferruginibacter sp.]|nr:hypothetical protein [Ferruginibacter sp.]
MCFKTTVLFSALIFSIAFTASAQVTTSIKKNTKTNYLLLAAFKKTVQPNPLLAQRIKPLKNELMYWSAFNLTADQIAYRENNQNQSVGNQIAHDIVSNYVNVMLYGKKTPVAVRPRF